MDDEWGIRRSYGKDETMGLFVALYLIVLGFFVVLQASSQETASKSDKAVSSVKRVFGNNSDVEVTGITSDVGPQQKQRPNALSKIETIFREEVALRGRFLDGGGRIYRVEFPQQFLFERGSIDIRQDRHSLLSKIFKALSKADGSGAKKYEVSFLFSVEDVSQSLNATSQILLLQRINQFGKFIETQTDVVNRTSIGLAEGDSGLIVAHFRIGQTFQKALPLQSWENSLDKESPDADNLPESSPVVSRPPVNSPEGPVNSPEGPVSSPEGSVS